MESKQAEVVVSSLFYLYTKSNLSQFPQASLLEDLTVFSRGGGGDPRLLFGGSLLYKWQLVTPLVFESLCVNGELQCRLR